MPRLTAWDEYFAHQIPEPLPQTSVRHHHWRESYFFVTHPRTGNDGDVLILAMAHYPARGDMDALLMGRVAGTPLFGFYRQPGGPDGRDPRSNVVGGASVQIVEPYRTVRLRAEPHEQFVSFDLTFTARTPAYGLRRGRLEDADGIVWDQSHMIQSGVFDGSYTWRGETRDVQSWWGQRDHSWGIRDHARCPMWMWLAIQLPDGMLGVWHWETANGARVFTDGCWSPADGSEPVPVADFRHDLHWTADGKPADYGQNGQDVTGMAGRVEITLVGGRTIAVDGSGTWAVRYGALGGGQNHMEVRTDDGRQGNGQYEVTGCHHHRYFPVHRTAEPRR